MRLTTHSDYALRVLIHLARKRGEPATIREIAAAYGISRNHLMKVVRRLARFGYLRTARGRGGGIALARAPGEIVVGDVLRRTEDSFALAECFDPASDRCAISQDCGLKPGLGAALDAFLAALDRLTLEDIALRGGASARLPGERGAAG